MTVDGSTITSPDYGSFNGYGKNKDCRVTIRFATDHMVAIRFEKFDVEHNRTNCGFDYLAVHDGDNISSPMIGPKLCGTITTGTTLQSTTNVMTLHFHANLETRNKGFKIYADVGKKFDTIQNCLADVNRSFIIVFVDIEIYIALSSN